MTNEPGTEAPKHKPRMDVYWTSISYRTVAIYSSLAFVLIITTVALVYPDWFSNLFRRLSEALTASAPAPEPGDMSKARFVNLDGRVQVKKVDSVQWANADRGMTLDRGDLVQTGPDGLARITFADGTTYTVKPDTLITVEENTVGQNQPTRVGVAIRSGAVDLSTPSWQVPGSRADVSFEDAQASLRQNSRAAVRSDPTKRQHEITVGAGSGEIVRRGERIELGRWEKASFATGGTISKERVLAPPELAQPMNLQPIIVANPRGTQVRFEWRQVPGAAVYHLRVSTTAMFSHLVSERRVSGTSTSLSGFDAGDYFWAVTAHDARNRSSEPSDTYKFTLAAQGRGEEMMLDVEGTQLHGNVVEVIGRTEPGAAIIINGMQVANIQPDGRFRHFTAPMGRGSQTIVITGQNRRGGTAIKRVPIVVP